MTFKISPFLMVAGCLASVTVSAESGLNPVLNEKFTFRLGGAYLDGSAKVASDIKGGDVAEMVPLGELGVDGDTLSPYFSARWRFTERFQTTFEYYGWDDDGSGLVQNEIEFGDIVIPPGAKASAELDVDIYAIALGWSFVRNEKTDIGIGIGVHVADVATSISGRGFIGDQPAQEASASTTLTAPLPNIRLYGSYALTPKLALEGGLGYFSLNYDKYDGDLLVANVALEYRFTDRFGVGLGYSLFDVNLDVDEDRTDDQYDVDLGGPVLFLSAGF